MFLIKTKLIETPHKGIGVECKQVVLRNTIVWKYCTRFNKTFDLSELTNLTPIEQEFIDTYTYTRLDGKIELDLDNSRFMNHSDKPNTSFPIDSEYGYAIKDILIGDELTCDYREFDRGSEGNLGFTNKEV